MKRSSRLIDDEDDDFDEEAEAREIYGDAYPGTGTSDEGQVTRTEKSSPPYEGGVAAASADGVVLSSATGNTKNTEKLSEEVPTSDPSSLAPRHSPNYHHLRELTDEHLPDLDYWRSDNLFLARPASNWATKDSKNNAVQRPLFGEFWNEGELAIMFADTGKGKSILAVQIAESIASARAIKPFRLGTKPQRVLLFDFELDDRQFSLRYSAKAGKSKREFYKFSDNFIRAKIGDVDELPPEFKTFNEFLTWSLVELIEFTAARVVSFIPATPIGAPRCGPRESEASWCHGAHDD